MIDWFGAADILIAWPGVNGILHACFVFSVGLDCPINTPSHKANCIITMKVWPRCPVVNDIYTSRPDVHINLFGYTSAACILFYGDWLRCMHICASHDVVVTYRVCLGEVVGQVCATLFPFYL